MWIKLLQLVKHYMFWWDTHTTKKEILGVLPYLTFICTSIHTNPLLLIAPIVLLGERMQVGAR